MSFCEHCKKITQPIWDAQFLHPFVQGLGDGSLPQSKFKFYILKDGTIKSWGMPEAEMAWREEKWPI